MQQHAERFDSQADTFDQRKGLPPDVAAAVAHEVVGASKANADDLVVELGAGTGEIGRHLAVSVRYVGIDGSSAMLDVFRAKLDEAGRQVQLVHADADDDWPVPSGSAAAVFASRAAHLLDPDHLVVEVRRVCRPRGAFLVGRVQRDPDGVQSRMRRERRRLLDKRESGEEATERIIERLVSVGATPLDPRSVATWTTSTSPAQVLAGWSTETDAPVLQELREWAQRQFGDLDRVVESAEQYTLAGAVLPEEPWTTRS